MDIEGEEADSNKSLSELEERDNTFPIVSAAQTKTFIKQSKK